MAVIRYIFGLLVFALLLAGLYFLALRQLATGYVDKYYPKFTQEAGSLVIGLSRAQYGLVPSVLEEAFPDSTKPMVNFAFELYQSPYGEILLEDVKNKIRRDVGNGIFILEVSPASFLIPTMVPEDKVYELDQETILGKMHNVAAHPNYEYLKKCYGSALYKGIFRMKPFGNITVHENGWVAFSKEFDFYTVTNEMTAQWKQETLTTYHKVVSQQKKSTSRIQSFIEIVEFLNKRGVVHIVRMPASKEVISFENRSWPTFSAEIKAIATQQNVSFFDYSQQNEAYNFYDGSHLFDVDAKAFTAKLCNQILNSEF